MALVTFSFLGTLAIKVTGGASAGTLDTVANRRILSGISWASGNSSKGEVIRMTNLRTGGTVFVTRTAYSFDSGYFEWPDPIPMEGILLSMPNGIEGLIYPDISGGY